MSCSQMGVMLVLLVVRDMRRVERIIKISLYLRSLKSSLNLSPDEFQ